MGFDEGRIILDNETGTYFAGQTINGKLVFDQAKEKSFRGIYIKFKGLCKVHWTTSHSRTVNGQQRSYTEVHESNEEYFNSKFYLIGGENGEQTIKPGHYEFPFQYTIPPSCPSSFQGSYGHISYEIKVVVDRAYKLDQTKNISFKVVAPFDLNLDPYCKEPIEMEFEESYCCWCMSAGSVHTVIKIPVAGYIPGQKIPIEIGCNNTSSVKIDIVRFTLHREVQFQAEVNPDSKTEREKVSEIKQGPIPANTTRNMNVDFEIPLMDVYNVNSCRFIDIEYELKVEIETSGCHNDTEQTRRIVIGTIPLVGFQDSTNPTNIPVQQSYPGFGITTQPYPSGGYPYPTNTPYPTPAHPAPPGFTNGHGGLPNSQYPPPPGPYPGANAYPPPGGSPYPPNAGPYPPNTSPYPPTSTPYPPAANPFPPTSSPYPNHPSPYAGNGQAPSKDGANIPLLPSTGIVPMPTHQPASPFVGASAPEPSTPDIYGKPTSPFNPEFFKSEEKM